MFPPKGELAPGVESTGGPSFSGRPMHLCPRALDFARVRYGIFEPNRQTQANYLRRRGNVTDPASRSLGGKLIFDNLVWHPYNIGKSQSVRLASRLVIKANFVEYSALL